jgi:triosephosphate isomerase
MPKPRGILIAGNWKMNSLPQETEAFFATLKSRTHEFIEPEHATLFEGGRLRVVLCPPYLCLERAAALASHLNFPLQVSTQNAHWEKKGAFTGEISGPMLQAIGIQWSLVGHSERRQLFGETDITVEKKATSLLEQGFHVILCIGETRAERESGKTHEVLARQLESALPQASTSLIRKALPQRFILAYEPVWAIGTGLTATPEQAQEAHHFIRQHLTRLLGAKDANATAILYGGSVTPDNIDSLLAEPDVDGALVGGASLKAEWFLALMGAGCRALIGPQ